MGGEFVLVEGIIMTSFGSESGLVTSLVDNNGGKVLYKIAFLCKLQVCCEKEQRHGFSAISSKDFPKRSIRVHCHIRVSWSRDYHCFKGPGVCNNKSSFSRIQWGST